MKPTIQKFKNTYTWQFLKAIYKFFARQIYNFMPKTMMGRSLLIIVMPILILQIIIGVYFYKQHWKAMANRLTNYLVGDIHFIIDQKENIKSDDEWQYIIKNAREKMSLIISFRQDEIILTKEPDRSIFTNTKLERILRQQLQHKIHYPYYLNLWSFEKNIEIKIQLKDGVLRILTSRKRLFSSTLYIILIWMIVASLILTTISIIFMSNQIRPIRRLAKSAERFGKGQNVQRIKPSGSIEIRKATYAFNQMSKRIVKQIHQRTEMLAGVSHDLRTPLTRMSLQLALIENGQPVSDEEIESFKSDIIEMEKMIEAYLSFAQGGLLETSENIDIGLFLNKIFKRYIKPEYEMSLHVDNQIFCEIKPNSLTRCIENIINNSARYAKKIDIKAWEDLQNIYIQIEDNGPGIPKEQRKNVFKAFYRIDPSRNKETGGIGLGLAIAKDIVNSHGGSIELDNSPLGGLKTLIILPL